MQELQAEANKRRFQCTNYGNSWITRENLLTRKKIAKLNHLISIRVPVPYQTRKCSSQQPKKCTTCTNLWITSDKKCGKQATKKCRQNVDHPNPYCQIKGKIQRWFCSRHRRWSIIYSRLWKRMKRTRFSRDPNSCSRWIPTSRTLTRFTHRWINPACKHGKVKSLHVRRSARYFRCRAPISSNLNLWEAQKFTNTNMSWEHLLQFNCRSPRSRSHPIKGQTRPEQGMKSHIYSPHFLILTGVSNQCGKTWA